MGNTSNILYDLGDIGVRALGKHSQIWLFDIRIVAIISTSWLCNGRQGRLLLERPGKDLKK